MKTKILMMLSVITMCYGSLLAQKPSVIVSDKPGWHKITECRVSYKTDKDEVLVVGNNHFKQVKLKAEDAPVDLKSLEVYYYDVETPQSIDVGMPLAKDQETQAFDLTNPDKRIRKIVLIYKTIPVRTDEKERAEIEIMGMK